jgi:spermidine synthase
VPVKKQPAPALDLPSLAHRRYLYFSAAVTGAAIMIVEILGAKMLAPYFGTSHFVWTAQIAVTLVALATGDYAGGAQVDRSPRLRRLYGSVLVAGLYLSLTVWMVRPLAYWCLQFNLAFGSLLASATLFFVPLSLLAMVCPFLIRVLTVSVSGVGGNVGRLTAVSTLGSFAGTLLIGYLLIPFLPNSMTMLITAMALMLVAGGFFWTWGKANSDRITAALALALGAAIGWGAGRTGDPEGGKLVELYHGNSNFGQLQVVQARNGPRRYYLNDYLTQNTYDTNEHQSLSMFTYMLHELPRAYAPRIEDVLCIGLGVGIVPMEFAREGARVDVVEINPAVVPLAREFFELQPERLNITIGDGRQFVNQSRKQYDVIVLDAFLGESSPSHLFTREAFGAMRRILATNGVLVINCFGDFDRGKDFFVASLEKTLGNVFASVRIHNEHNGGNVLFVASPQARLNLRQTPDFARMNAGVRRSVEIAFDRIVESDPNHGIVLTDDFNPTDYYDAVNRERFRRELAFALRNL